MRAQVYKALRDGVQDVAVKKLKVDATASGVQAFLEVWPQSHNKRSCIQVHVSCALTAASHASTLATCLPAVVLVASSDMNRCRSVLHTAPLLPLPLKLDALSAGVQHPQVVELRQEHRAGATIGSASPLLC